MSTPASETKAKIVVGVTGASGAPYAKRLLAVLDQRRRASGDVELAVCLSPTAPEVWSLECGGDVREHLREMGVPVWGLRDYRAPFASGSAGWQTMIIVPCSMGTAARIAHGISDSLLTRAADVMLKERRRLILVPRETPLSVIHLENLTALARAGATILPAMPAFYSNPRTLEDAVDGVVARILDQAGIGNDLMRRWGEGSKP
ncbi:UbiX family flavin prenyltransferase [Pendulispora albinea]|uniref:Flavin prenyltransferase UbiX n=1 Tax=Pendulispora albinea TaxID=2741071 RepID=A0ABZ2LN05_9BACT